MRLVRTPINNLIEQAKCPENKIQEPSKKNVEICCSYKFFPSMCFLDFNRQKPVTLSLAITFVQQ